MARSTGADIFGREKLPDDLDNRKGAGSYERDMTTLYVHYGGAGGYAVPQLRHLLLQVCHVLDGATKQPHAATRPPRGHLCLGS